MLMAAGATAEEAKSIHVYGLYTTAKRDEARWGVRQIAPELQSLTWRIPRGQNEVEKWIEEMRRYVPQEHPGDRLMAGYFANQRLQGMGVPLPLLARSISVRRA